MSFMIADFSGQIALVIAMYKWDPNAVAELNALATALTADVTTHSTELATAPAGLIPGQASNKPLTNDMLLIINAGKAGNLTAAAMAAAITTAVGLDLVPVNTTAPVVSGTGTVGQTLTSTAGVWNYTPTGYAYQWRRGATNIAGATSTTYVLVAADSGTSITCRVTATNASGVTAAASNAIAVA